MFDKDMEVRALPVVKHRVEEVYEVLAQGKKDVIPDGIKLMNIQYLWDKGYTGKGVKIAVIDTGCDPDHPDLKDRIIDGKNFTHDDKGREDKYDDYNGHGTHVAGTIAASNNKFGLVGVAPDAQLLILKGLGKNGGGSVTGIIRAIEYAIEQKVDIISMSLGMAADAKPLHDAIKKAVNNDILVVCAAGNEGDSDHKTDEYAYPAGYPEVISVGAIDYNKLTSGFSNSNKEVDVVAPGVDILSTYLKGQYAALSGTSMATPHVSGVLALLIEWSRDIYGRELLESELYGQLIKNTQVLDMDRKLQGSGLVYLDPKNF